MFFQFLMFSFVPFIYFELLFDMFFFDVMGEKAGSPQNLKTIFIQTCMKSNKLVEPEVIVKHVCLINWMSKLL